VAVSAPLCAVVKENKGFGMEIGDKKHIDRNPEIIFLLMLAQLAKINNKS
jgi:hypothetical protein